MKGWNVTLKLDEWKWKCSRGSLYASVTLRRYVYEWKLKIFRLFSIHFSLNLSIIHRSSKRNNLFFSFSPPFSRTKRKSHLFLARCVYTRPIFFRVELLQSTFRSPLRFTFLEEQLPRSQVCRTRSKKFFSRSFTLYSSLSREEIFNFLPVPPAEEGLSASESDVPGNGRPNQSPDTRLLFYYAWNTRNVIVPHNKEHKDFFSSLPITGLCESWLSWKRWICSSPKRERKERESRFFVSRIYYSLLEENFRKFFFSVYYRIHSTFSSNRGERIDSSSFSKPNRIVKKKKRKKRKFTFLTRLGDTVH